MKLLVLSFSPLPCQLVSVSPTTTQYGRKHKTMCLFIRTLKGGCDILNVLYSVCLELKKKSRNDFTVANFSRNMQSQFISVSADAFTFTNQYNSCESWRMTIYSYAYKPPKTKRLNITARATVCVTSEYSRISLYGLLFL